MRRLLVSRLRKEGEQEIADDRADVEADRADERELGVDDARVVWRRHDRAGVQVAVDQRLGAGQEPIFQRLRGDLDRAVALERSLLRIEPGLRPAIERRLAIRIGEDQILGDLALGVFGANSASLRLVLGRRPGELGGEEQRRGGELVMSSTNRGYPMPPTSPLRRMMCG